MIYLPIPYPSLTSLVHYHLTPNPCFLRDSDFTEPCNLPFVCLVSFPTSASERFPLENHLPCIAYTLRWSAFPWLKGSLLWNSHKELETVEMIFLSPKHLLFMEFVNITEFLHCQTMPENSKKEIWISMGSLIQPLYKKLKFDSCW